jgi:hypothetical protein
MPIISEPLDAAAEDGTLVDLEVVLGNYSLAVFGELAFDVSV